MILRRHVPISRFRSLHASSLHHVIAPSLGFLLLASAPAAAFDIESAQTAYRDRHYEYDLVATLDAPLERVQAVLRDYEHYGTLDERILEAHVIERPSASIAILATTLRVCFGPFCRNVKRVERVEESPLGLSAIADPARSEVKFGETRVYLALTADGRTRISYRTSIVPDFWIPPIPGRRWMLRTLADSTIDLFRGVEKRAQEMQAP